MCARVCVLLLPVCFIIKNQRAQFQTDEWVDLSLSLSLSIPPSLPLTLTLLSYLTLHPSAHAENLTVPLQLTIMCGIFKGEWKQ